MKNLFKRKNQGSISIGILLSWFLFIILILLSFSIEIYFVNLRANMVRDDIVLSNLATYKDIDLRALGDDPSVFKLSNPKKALSTFKIYLKKNMRLDDNMCGKDNSAAIGQVIIKQYIIYNISGNNAEIYTYDTTNGEFIRSVVNDITNNPIVTPYGTVVKRTSIHTTLEFQIQTILNGFSGNKRSVKVMADTDITY